ncbi:uncharacterized protein LOC128271925 [Anopheles cruzii]|uniref:uncharacterized protein LOC128271925 n=1 Tax=Anopheles cruzii TaxID=68878 RepID=UPI0022EC3D3A|nr:uncharacterized protein LOC128271925 [Anopheles cruzii]
MNKGRLSTCICLWLVVMVMVNAPPTVTSQPCSGVSSGPLGNALAQQRTKGSARAGFGSPPAAIASSTPTAIKKDLFMSRGWGASGMPFSMFYLNHYTKAQKAFAQTQLQQQQQQQQQQLLQQQQQQQLQHEQQAQQAASLRIRSQDDTPLTRTQKEVAAASLVESVGQPLVAQQLPFPDRYGETAAAVHAEKLRTDADYVDNNGGATVRAGAKGNATRRQYTVPQLFVSYGWGPMG